MGTKLVQCNLSSQVFKLAKIAFYSFLALFELLQVCIQGCAFLCSSKNSKKLQEALSGWSFFVTRNIRVRNSPNFVLFSNSSKLWEFRKVYVSHRWGWENLGKFHHYRNFSAKLGIFLQTLWCSKRNVVYASAHSNRIQLAAGFRYLPDRFLRWMFQGLTFLLRKSVSSIYRLRGVLSVKLY